MGQIDTAALRAANEIVSVVGSYVALKKIGSEYRGLCPFHADTSPSFYAVPSKQIWRCFSCCADEEHGSDVIGFIQGITGKSFVEACEMLGAEKREWKPVAAIEQVGKPKPERVTSLPPAGESLAAEKMALRHLGVPEEVREFRTLDNELHGYECRYKRGADPEKPDTAPSRVWTWGQREGEKPGWACAFFTKPRPLYGLERIGERPGALVAVFEGPKKADAGQRLLGGTYNCVSWTGGAGSWHLHDWSPLAKKAVLLWPDADRKLAKGRQAETLGVPEGSILPYPDQPGPKAMASVATLLADTKGLACVVRYLDVSDVPADGYDIADMEKAGMTKDEVFAWARKRACSYVYPNPAPPVAADHPTASASTPEPEGAGPAESDAPPEPPPPIDFPPEAQDEPQRKPKRQRPRLATVEGNLALAPEAEPEAAPLSHDALAEHFVGAHHEDWRYVAQWGKWFQWHADRWQEDVTERPVGLAKMTTRASLYWPEAAGLTSDGRRKVNSIMTAKALLGFARADEKIAARVDQWDKEPWLLGVPGGVLELQSGKMLEAVRTQYITKQCAIAPAGGKPSRWLDFLARVTDDNPNMIAFLHRSAGYWLTGITREHSLTFLYGTGANGKSVFMRTLGGILGLGEYARSCQMTVFTESKLERHSTDLAELRGARLVMAEETGGGAKWDQAKIQWLTGEGAVTARFMRMDNFTYQPMFKLLFAGNHKPKLTSVDEAIRRRFHLVPFTVTIPPEQRDAALFEKLREEWPQILGWMLDGCAEWQRIGLAAPAEVREATDTYLETEDAIGQWMDECCERKDRAFGSTLYESYRRWCEKVGEHPWTRRAWSNALIERGFQNKKGTDNAPMFLGLRLRDGANL